MGVSRLFKLNFGDNNDMATFCKNENKIPSAVKQRKIALNETILFNPYSKISRVIN